ncbi:MAG: hypothetical protein L7S67_02780, partial [Flavobacteriales bacterium]|nr:hypothetical protein [Flavobacteriales bacterium]
MPIDDNPQLIAFFKKVKDEMESILHGIRTTLERNASNEKDASAKYAKCLASIERWDDSVRSDEMSRIKKKYPSIENEYLYTVTYLVQETYGKQHQKRRVRIPPFNHFLFKFYKTVVRSLVVQQNRYFSLTFEEANTLMKQSFLSALFDIESQSTYSSNDLYSMVSQSPYKERSVPPKRSGNLFFDSVSQVGNKMDRDLSVVSKRAEAELNSTMLRTHVPTHSTGGAAAAAGDWASAAGGSIRTKVTSIQQPIRPESKVKVVQLSTTSKASGRPSGRSKPPARSSVS